MANAPTKKAPARKKSSKKTSGIEAWWQKMSAPIRRWRDDLLSRRPHRSFQRTRRRDYARSLKLPGYLMFTKDVFFALGARRWLFVKLTVFYAIAIAVLGGVTDQQAYTQIGELLRGSTGEIIRGSWGKVGEAGVLLLSAFGGGSGSTTVDQQIYLSLALLFVWLTTVWLLREVLAGRRPRMRDGLYNGGAPFVSTFAILLVAVAQLLPFAISAAVVVGLSGAGLANEGFGAMLAYIFLGTVAALTLYWLTSTFIAGVIVTLPGMYPGRALRAAGDLVIGRRVRICLRVVWMAVALLIVWAVVAIPLIMFDTWLKDIWKPFAGFPLMPIVIATLSAMSVIWAASYIYLLYRKIVDDDARPA